MKKGQSVTKIVAITLAVVVFAVVVFFSVRYDLIGRTGDLFPGINNTQQTSFGSDVSLGYKIFESKAAYYDGNEWIDLTGKLVVGDKEFDGDTVKKAFTSFYFSGRESYVFALGENAKMDIFGSSAGEEIDSELNANIAGMTENDGSSETSDPVVRGFIKSRSGDECYASFYVDNARKITIFKVRTINVGCVGSIDELEISNNAEIRKIVDESINWRDVVLKGASGQKEILIRYRDVRGNEGLQIAGYVEKIEGYLFVRLNGARVI